MTKIKLFIISRPFRAIFTLRLFQALKQNSALRPLAPLAAVAHRWTAGTATMDLPLRTSIGPGLMIAHGWGLVVNANSRIGRNVTLFHGVTLGQGDRIARDGERTAGYPTLGDNVWVGPNAAILGGVHVGEGSRILAGAIVTSDVPAFSMVGGNPAVIVKENCTPDVGNPIP